MSTVFYRMMIRVVFVLLFSITTPILSSAQILQVDLSIPMSTGPRSHTKFKTPIQGGPATLTGTIRNLQGKETVRVDLMLDYTIPQGTIAFDELIHEIEITTKTQDGEIFGSVIIDAQLIPLNPNRAPLFYCTTLYYPQESKTYLVHIRVFGNYE
ncbi:MAG: hypothetical protein HXY44_16295 [Syntrophaceae bacterium]|nr:hypothetical protein [Syntrophaceae bacterium]